METKKCKKCGKIITKKATESKEYWKSKRFCSIRCASRYLEYGHYKRTPEHIKKMKIATKMIDHTMDGIRMTLINESRKGKRFEEIYGKEKAEKIKQKHRKVAEDNHNWRGGSSFMPYSHKFTVELKKRIKELDGNKCKNCNISQEEECKKDYRGRGLTIHHIDYDKMNTDVVNLITLCRRCNSMANGNKQEWIKKYKKLRGAI